MKLFILPSDKGDCLLLRGDDGTTMLIDGGMRSSYDAHVRPFWKDWVKKNGDTIDLAYVSHIDQDHIAGVLRMFDDLAAWRVFEHQKNNGGVKPSFPRPPTPKHLWHNSFHDQVQENSEDIESALAASAAVLSNSSNARALGLAEEYREIATSIPEAIKLSRRASPEQLGIPINEHFGRRLAMVRSNNKPIKLGKLNIRVIGPFKDDLEKLRDDWNTWLESKKGMKQLKEIHELVEDQEKELGAAVRAAGFDDSDLGKRSAVTAPNLASLMLLVEEAGKSIVLTGDGHHEEISRGLEDVGVLKKGKGGHVDVLKVAHHGSEHNTDRAFAKRLTADHYIFCGNGKHENPDERVVQVYLESRLGSGDKLSANPQAKNPFTFWFSSSSSNADADKVHMRRLEKLVARFDSKRLKVKHLKGAPLELTL